MKRAVTIVAVLGAASFGWAPVLAEAGSEKQKSQTQTPFMEQKSATEQKMEMGKVAEGKIKAVDQQGMHLELDNGTRLTVPSTIGVKRTDLKVGTTVKAHYEEKGGEKVVTQIEVNPRQQSPGTK